MSAASALLKKEETAPQADDYDAAFERDVHCVLGLPFDAVDLTGAESIVRDAAARGRRCFVSTPNVNFAIGCLGDAALRDSVLARHLSLADGMPIVWLARLLGAPLRGRAAGADLFERLRRPSAAPLSVYFFGGPAGAAQAAAERLNAARGGLACVGYESPGFGPAAGLAGEESIARINASGADFLVV